MLFKPVTLKYQNDGGCAREGLKPGTKIELNEFVRSAHRLRQSGFVGSQKAVDKADEITRSVKGVKAVKNDLIVK
jgi:hypothetical protein